MPVPRQNVIVVAIDRLHAGMLGAYGNAWVHTDHFDHLACESFLFDQAFVESPSLEAIYRAYWSGTHDARGAASSSTESNLLQLLGAAGWHTTLLTDEPQLLEYKPAADFVEQRIVETPDARVSAADMSETQLARLFMAATDWLASPHEPFCLWIHARALGGPWDAPLEMRRQYAEEEDPAPPDFVDVPDRMLAADYDPDELLGISHAYAGQVSLLDRCLGALMDQLAESGLASTAQLTLLSARGFPLGEHLRVGPCDEALYNETLQIPLLMRFPDELGRMARSQALVLPSDLPGTLLDWLKLDRSPLAGGRATSLLPIIRGEQAALRDHVCMTSSNERAIRTHAWFLRQPDNGAAELFAKPADRWEVNEAARLCDGVVVGLQQALAAHQQAGPDAQLPPLADELVTEWD
jgi:arylsulfatase A-like enzyme